MEGPDSDKVETEVTVAASAPGERVILRDQTDWQALADQVEAKDAEIARLCTRMALMQRVVDAARQFDRDCDILAQYPGHRAHDTELHWAVHALREDAG